MGSITTKTSSVPGLLRRGMLAWIGAVVTVQEEYEGWVRRLVERGELAEREGRELVMSLVAERRRSHRPQARASLSCRVVDWTLQRMGRPTMRETRAVAEQITALEARVEALAA